jgi:serine/threonine protein kinase
MGAVYLAKDMKEQGQQYAIKEISVSLIPQNEQQKTINNFKSEAKMLWSLHHPNLPSMRGVFAQEDRYFLVMEYIDGYTLEELLERNGGPFPERRVLDWARQLCDVLAYLHSHSPPIIFRDMKPGNIMLTRNNGQIKLIDFGIARFFRPSHAQDTQVLGTPGYAPPEQYGKAQTDERSDIYALAMTLFHLLTNTLSDEGFGLENVRQINARISPMVARALEKATSIKPSDRYESVEMFRHALLGVGTFGFATGEVASTPEELAALCAHYPEEAAEYLVDNEIESWLLDLGEDELSEIASHLAQTVHDPVDAIEQFVETVLTSKNSVPRYSNNTSTINSNVEANTSNVQVRNPTTRHQTPPPLTNIVNNRLRQTPKRGGPVPVSPRILDFGTVYPGISAPLKITIGDTSGYPIAGMLHTPDTWIQLSQASFDTAQAEISVRVNSLQLARNSHYSGTIVIDLEDNTRGEIVVKVEAEVQGYIVRNKRHPGRTNGADLDYYDDDDDLDSQGAIPAVGSGSTARSLTITPPILVQKHGTDLDKFGTPYVNDWQLNPMGIILRKWQQLGLTLAGSFMAASLGYIWLEHVQPPPLMPHPLFLLVLFIAIPAATLGALVVQRGNGLRRVIMLNRALTGMTSSLTLLGLSEFIWQIVALHVHPGWIQLVVMLMAAAIGAMLGVYRQPSMAILGCIKSIQATTKQSHWMMVVLAILVGGLLGVFLTFGITFGLFTVSGMLLAIGIIVGLVERVDYLVKYKRL